MKIKERTASEVETARECAKPAKYPEGHANLSGKVNQGGHTHTSVDGEQGHTTANLHGQKAKWA